MFEILKNSWFIGITTGIISGLLVYLITNRIMKKKGKEEYFQQVTEANRYVISILKPYISEKGLPDVEIFRALISSTARACSIKEMDMFSIAVFCEELIREIISDVYVSTDKKKEYTDNLIEYKKGLLLAEKEKEKEGEIDTRFDYYNLTFWRKRMTAYISVITAVFTTFVALVLVLGFDKKMFWYPFEDKPYLWPPIIAIIIVITSLSLVALDSLNRIRKTNYLKDYNSTYNSYYRRMVSYYNAIRDRMNKNDSNDQFDKKKNL